MRTKISSPAWWRAARRLFQLRRIEIRHRLISAFVLLALLPLIISGYISFVDSNSAIESRTRVFSTEMVKQVSKNIKLRMEQIDVESATLVLSNPVQDALSAFSNDNETERSTARRTLTQVLLDRYGAINYVNQKYFLDRQNRVVDMQVFAQLTSGVARFVEGANTAAGLLHWGSYDNGVGQQNIGMVRTVVSKNSNEVIGALFLAINPDHFSAIFDNVDLGGGADIFVIDRETGKVLVWSQGKQSVVGDNFSSAATMLNKMAEGLKVGDQSGAVDFNDSNHEPYVATYATIPGTAWLVVNTIPKSRLTAEIQAVRNKMGLIGILCFLVAIALGTMIASTISRPLKELMNRMQETGNLVNPSAGRAGRRAVPELEGMDELGRLALSFAAMNDIVNQTIADINENNATLEQKILERTAALAASEQESRTLIDNSPDTIARYDLQCRRTFVNPMFCQMAPDGANSLLGKRPSESPGGPHGEWYEKKLRQVIATGTNDMVELRWVGRNGQEICSHIRLTAEFDTAGNIISVIGVGRDITELSKSRAELNAANEQLARMNAMLESLATQDPLTQLPNRRLLLDRLHKALSAGERNGHYGAIMFIDLDNFKTLNDTLGHDLGDMLLRQVAQRLQASVRDADTVARIGGDEFIVMLESLSETPIEAAAQTEIVGHKILDLLNQPYEMVTSKYQLSASIGATLFNDNRQSAEELLRQGDIAMYQAKKSGRNALRFFDPRMQEVVNARALLETELRMAITTHQFQLYYQIQIQGQQSNGSLRPSGAEALIRWIHPTRGVIAPDTFIALAEETGLILPIGQWVLSTACAQLSVWQHDPLTRNLVLSVNVSARQFLQPDFVAQVQTVIARHGINPKRLKLELTEGLLLENIDDTIGKMNLLNQIGVKFSLDDFGTGYSSLQYLKRLPLDQLKIDRSFVRDIVSDSSDLAIVSTIIAMAKSLNLNVIAEGVETEAQFRLLLNHGCLHYQGYLFSRPVPIGEFENHLKKNWERVLITEAVL